MGYMNHRHGLIRQSVLGLQTLSNIVFAMALIMSQLSWAATSPVTIGGPFTLIAPDGTTVTDQTFRGKWLLVYFGYTFCPNTCPMTLNEIATALEKLGADAAKINRSSSRSTRSATRAKCWNNTPSRSIRGSSGSLEIRSRSMRSLKEYGAYSGRP